MLEFKWPSSYQLDDLAAGLHRLFVDRFSATFPNAVVHLNVSENEPLLCKEEHPEDLATMHEVHRALSDVKVGFPGRWDLWIPNPYLFLEEPLTSNTNHRLHSSNVFRIPVSECLQTVAQASYNRHCCFGFVF